MLAPHIDDDKGLLGAQKAQILQLFQHDEVAGLELGDHKLPDDAIENRQWLQEGNGLTSPDILCTAATPIHS